MGDTSDREFLEIAARAAGRSELLEGRHIAAAGGASRGSSMGLD